ncbi:hypothetical protein GCM10010433_05710 [Streptomyces pulveraceus]|uniref:Uncharacterized protein n=1 Tax=Streptomyces pulveraceus TaxID=68258 RepID=A0ABW1GPC0_9ACTN
MVITVPLAVLLGITLFALLKMRYLGPGSALAAVGAAQPITNITHSLLTLL